MLLLSGKTNIVFVSPILLIKRVNESTTEKNNLITLLSLDFYRLASQRTFWPHLRHQCTYYKTWRTDTMHHIKRLRARAWAHGQRERARDGAYTIASPFVGSQNCDQYVSTVRGGWGSGPRPTGGRRPAQYACPSASADRLWWEGDYPRIDFSSVKLMEVNTV